MKRRDALKTLAVGSSLFFMPKKLLAEEKPAECLRVHIMTAWPRTMVEWHHVDAPENATPKQCLSFALSWYKAEIVYAAKKCDNYYSKVVFYWEKRNDLWGICYSKLAHKIYQSDTPERLVYDIQFIGGMAYYTKQNEETCEKFWHTPSNWGNS